MREKWGRRAGRQERGAGRGKIPVACTNEEEEGRKVYVRASFQSPLSCRPPGEGGWGPLCASVRCRETELSPDLLTEGAGTCGCEPDASYNKHRLLLVLKNSCTHSAIPPCPLKDRKRPPNLTHLQTGYQASPALWEGGNTGWTNEEGGGVASPTSRGGASEGPTSCTSCSSLTTTWHCPVCIPRGFPRTQVPR